jgi:O-methyltransferase
MVKKMDRERIPDYEFYSPLFSPWKGYGKFKDYYTHIKDYTLVSPDRCYILYVLIQNALNLKGEFWECGVYKGGTARMLYDIIRNESKSEDRIIRLFDTYDGMPETDILKDVHQKGNFGDTSLEEVKKIVGESDTIHYHKGFIPKTFEGLDGKTIALAHIDVDIYQSVLDCCEFIYPRITAGGVFIFDDYGFPSCPGARTAVDEYFSDKNETPIVLPTGQAIVFSLKK